jgi:hypothetical protein
MKPCPFEKAKRIRVAVWACAYELFNTSLVDDYTYDKLCKEINLEKVTDRPDLDRWFKENFSPDTGLWVHQHPDLDRLEEICHNIIMEKDRAYKEAFNSKKKETTNAE